MIPKDLTVSRAGMPSRSEEIAATDALLHANADLSRQIGELNTTIGYQDAMLRQFAADVAALRSIIADSLGFAWSASPRDPTNPRSAASVFARAHAALADEHPGAALLNGAPKGTSE